MQTTSNIHFQTGMFIPITKIELLKKIKRSIEKARYVHSFVEQIVTLDGRFGRTNHFVDVRRTFSPCCPTSDFICQVGLMKYRFNENENA